MEVAINHFFRAPKACWVASDQGCGRKGSRELGDHKTDQLKTRLRRGMNNKPGMAAKMAGITRKSAKNAIMLFGIQF